MKKPFRNKTFRSLFSFLLAALFCLQFTACALPAAPGGEATGKTVQSAGIPSGKNSEAETEAGSGDASGKQSLSQPELTAALAEADLMRRVTASAAAGKAADARFLASQFDFAAKVFTSAADGGKNVLVSPLSLSVALAMNANGAAGTTLSELETLLGDGMPIAELNDYLCAFLQTLAESKGSRFRFADSIWIKDDPAVCVKAPFLQTNADFYGAQAYQIPFDDRAAELVNEWCRQNTDGMIDEILPEIAPETLLLLLNALCFDAEWARIYETRDVRDGSFRAQDGSVRTVRMMHSEESRYLETEDASGFVKEYADGFYFAALLPDEAVGIEDFVASLTGEKLQTVLRSRRLESVDVTMPKFSVKSETEFAPLLKAHGAPALFDREKANLSGICDLGEDNLFVSSVLQKAFLSIDERGTRAGAVTVVVNTPTAMEPPLRSVTLDRPFVYMICDAKTDLPIFLGVQTAVDG